jgi:IclR-like helix-turn-helix domain-containing protein
VLVNAIAQTALIALRPDVDSQVVDAFGRLPDVDVVSNAPESAVVIAGQAFPVEVGVVENRELAGLLDGERVDGRRLLMIKAILDDATAARLEDADIGFVDAAGRAWLPGQSLTKRVRERLPARRRALRAGSLRPAQLIADHPKEAWTIRRLAERSASSEVTAHRLLKTLEEAHLIERHGHGRGMQRRVVDVEGIRRWLAEHGRPSSPQRLSCFVRDPNTIPASIAGYQMVFTGAGAAERMGLPVLTGVQRPLYRVQASGKDLEQIPQALGGFRTDRGANLTLIADPEHLAGSDARIDADGRAMAPLSRVMLDLYLEPRGEAAVGVFLDLWGSKDIA